MMKQISAAAFAAVVLAACGGGSGGSGSAATTAAATTAAPTTIAPTTIAPTTTVARTTTAPAPTTVATTTTVAAATTAPPVTTVAPTTTIAVLVAATVAPPADALAADETLAVDLYTAFSQSWKDGIDGGMAFIAAHDYPTFRYTPEECRATYFHDPSLKAFSETLVADTATMALDAGWTVPSGRYAGLHPDGRVYVVKINSTYAFNNAAPQQTSDSVHVSILNGTAYFFHGCDG